jgi:hypothetical protein
MRALISLRSCGHLLYDICHVICCYLLDHSNENILTSCCANANLLPFIAVNFMTFKEKMRVERWNKHYVLSSKNTTFELVSEWFKTARTWRSTQPVVKTLELFHGRADPVGRCWSSSFQLSGLLFSVYLTTVETPEKEGEKKGLTVSPPPLPPLLIYSLYIVPSGWTAHLDRMWVSFFLSFFFFFSFSLIYLWYMCIYVDRVPFSPTSSFYLFSSTSSYSSSFFFYYHSFGSAQRESFKRYGALLGSI